MFGKRVKTNLNPSGERKFLLAVTSLKDMIDPTLFPDIYTQEKRAVSSPVL
jgi:hypothetical protein